MRIELVFLGKTKEKYLAAGIEDFVKRLSRYTRLEIKIIKDISAGAVLVASLFAALVGAIIFLPKLF